MRAQDKVSWESVIHTGTTSGSFFIGVKMKQYCIFTQDPNIKEVFNWICANNLKSEVHLNRTRFWVPNGPIMTEFLLRYGYSCPEVEPTEDLQLGI